MYIFSFKSRSQAMRFYDLIRSRGGRSTIMNTPRQVAAGCGISVRVDYENLNLARNIMRQSSFDSFLGLFELLEERNGFSVRRI